jgi:hypothetical protein
MIENSMVIGTSIVFSVIKLEKKVSYYENQNAFLGNGQKKKFKVIRN